MHTHAYYPDARFTRKNAACVIDASLWDRLVCDARSLSGDSHGAFSGETVLRANHQEALVIALARAHRWKKLLDDGRFKSITDIAEAVGLDVSFAARIIRLTLLAPDIVEAILMGEEPSGLSLTKLTKGKSVIWTEQRKELGML